jgi:predicted RNase H-like nuclease (RuvC/YqgF family)
MNYLSKEQKIENYYELIKIRELKIERLQKEVTDLKKKLYKLEDEEEDSSADAESKRDSTILKKYKRTFPQGLTTNNFDEHAKFLSDHPGFEPFEEIDDLE